MQSMESAKTGLPVALADERLGAGWRRPRTAIRVVAVAAALVASAVVFGLFNRFGVVKGEAKPQRLLIGSIDMGIADREEGSTQARIDVKSGLLQLQAFGLAEPTTKEDIAKAQRLKQRYGIVWVNKGDAATPKAQAYADGYNRIVRAEIERRHGKDFLARLMRGEEGGIPKPQDKAATS